jgi:class 3 adenylate cyclase
MTVAAPSQVVTFLFTDIEGSTRRWESDADAIRAAAFRQVIWPQGRHEFWPHLV